MPMERSLTLDSILLSVKKSLGIEPDYNQFDPDLIMNINTAFFNLNQLGIGPEEGFYITGDSETWSSFTPSIARLQAVKTYVQLQTKLIFDPPGTSFVLDSLKKKIDELEWRLLVEAESIANA